MSTHLSCEVLSHLNERDVSRLGAFRLETRRSSVVLVHKAPLLTLVCFKNLLLKCKEFFSFLGFLRFVIVMMMMKKNIFFVFSFVVLEKTD